MFDEKCWELAGLFLGDEPEMLTPEHQRALAQACSACFAMSCLRKRGAEACSPNQRQSRAPTW